MSEEQKVELRNEVKLDVEWLKSLEQQHVEVCSVDNPECEACGS